MQTVIRVGLALTGIVFSVDGQDVDGVILSIGDFPRVERKAVDGLPPKSILVGYPEQVHYAFNPATQSIVAAWRGDFLKAAPVFSGDGRRFNHIGGEWIFRDDAGIRLLVDGNLPELRFVKYSVGEHLPLVECVDGPNRVQIVATPVNKGELRFRYRIIGYENRRISLRLPYNLRAKSDSGTILAGQLLVDTENWADFSITVLK